MFCNTKLNVHKNQEIECLRGIAILFTLFHHIAYYLVIHPNQDFINLYSYATFWAGVDLFFAISGFVIMQSFLKTLSIQDISFVNVCKIFWIKRIFRILPVAWLWLGIYLLLTVFFNYTGAFGNIYENLADAKAAVLQYANIYGVNCWGDNATLSCGPNGIYWSLSLEEQFYVLLPIAVFIFRNYLRYILMLAIIVIFFIERPEWSLGWALRVDAIMLGVLIAVYKNSAIWTKIRDFKLLKNKIFMRLFLVLSIIGIAYIPAKPNYVPYSVGVLALICALLVLIASFDKSYLVSNKKLQTILVWFGSRSYSIYLIHIIVFRLSYEIFYQMTPVGYKIATNDWYYLLAISIPILVILTELSYRFVELPMRNYGLALASTILNPRLDLPKS